MGDRRVGPSGPTLEAGGVVVDGRAVGPVVGEERLGTVSTLLILAGPVRGVSDLEAADDLSERGILAQGRKVLISAGELGYRRLEFNRPA